MGGRETVEVIHPEGPEAKEEGESCVKDLPRCKYSSGWHVHVDEHNTSQVVSRVYLGMQCLTYLQEW